MLFKQLRYSCIAGLVLLIFSWNTTYAETGSPDNWHGFGKWEDQSNGTDTAKLWRRTEEWENPITGQSVSLSKVYRYSTNIPGLSWRVTFFTRENATPSNSALPAYFEFFIIKLPVIWDFPDRELEDYDLKPDGYRKKICGQAILQGTAIDKKGKSYAFSQLQSVFGKDQKKYSVLFIHDIAEKQVALDEKVFCPIVQSFYPEKDSALPSVNHEYLFFNPLSDKPFLPDSSIKMRVEDIVSHRLGSHQVYDVAKGELRAELIKIRDRPYVFDFFRLFEIEKMSLLDGANFYWETKVSLSDDDKESESLRLKGRFTQITEKGEKRSGIVHHGYLGGQKWIFVKVWRPDGKTLNSDEHVWAEALFKNSIPD